jgi:hypothetical protein
MKLEVEKFARLDEEGNEAAQGFLKKVFLFILIQKSG